MDTENTNFYRTREKTVPEFPAQMEQNINDYLAGGSVVTGECLNALNPSNPPPPLSVRFTDRGAASQRP
ncbi:MAG: hypothetical protein ACM37Z_23105 [Deltaproteobacteria bacterium]